MGTVPPPCPEPLRIPWASMTPEQRQEWYRRETLRMQANIAAMRSCNSRSGDAAGGLWWALLGFFLGFVLGGMW